MRKIFLFFIFIFFILSSICFAAGSKVYFSPQGGCQAAVISEISKAQRVIDIAMYDFTSGPIAQELVRAKKRHVMVRMVLDRSQQTRSSSKSRYLASKGCDVRIHQGAGLMHNKFAVIDGQVLLTGSFNWTFMAEQKNQENLLIMTDQGLIKQYEKQFEYLYKDSDPMKAGDLPHDFHHRPHRYSLSPVHFF